MAIFKEFGFAGRLCADHELRELLGGQILGKQGTVILLSFGVGELFNQKTQIPVRFKAASLGGFYEAVESGGSMGAIGMSTEQPIFSSEDEWPDCIFRCIVKSVGVTPLSCFFCPPEPALPGWCSG